MDLSRILAWADCPKTKIEFWQDTIYGREQKQETLDVARREEESRVFGQPVWGTIPLGNSLAGGLVYRLI